MDNGGAQLVIFLLADPHLLEGGHQSRMKHPVLTEYLHSGGMMILTFIVLKVRAVISCMLSNMPEYMLVPSDSTVLAYKSFQMSTSHFMMELKIVLWMSQASIPRKEGWMSAVNTTMVTT